ncbi:hypothetical protein D3C87_1548210 [compost metagenome]
MAHAGVGIQRRLDLAGVDIEAGANDEVLDAAHDKERPVRVFAQEISRAQPAILIERLGGLLGRLVIALHDIGPLHQQLAHFTARDRIAAFVDDARPHARNQVAHAEVHASLPVRHHADGRRGFGKPVAVVDRLAENRLDARLERRIQRRAAAMQQPQRRRRNGHALLMSLQKTHVHGGHAM